MTINSKTITTMNAKVRKQIERIAEDIDLLKSTLEELMEDEQNKLDNMPESLQYSERGEAMQSAIDQLSYAIDNLQDGYDNLEEIYNP